MIDSLVNGMVNLIYIMISGALTGWYVARKQAKVEERTALQPRVKGKINVLR
jgi:hypothetical protein